MRLLLERTGGYLHGKLTLNLAQGGCCAPCSTDRDRSHAREQTELMTPVPPMNKTLIAYPFRNEHPSVFNPCENYYQTEWSSLGIIFSLSHSDPSTKECDF